MSGGEMRLVVLGAVFVVVYALLVALVVLHEPLWLEPPLFDYGRAGNAEAWREAVNLLQQLTILVEGLGNDVGNAALIYGMGDTCERARLEARRAAAENGP
jgi:hypothetical protein